MSNKRLNNMVLDRNLVFNSPNSTSYDVYLNNKGSKTTCSVWGIEQKSNTFHDTGKVIIGCKHSVSQKPMMDASAVWLQIALLQHASESKYYWSDLALQAMLVALCLYVTVSLVIWGSV